jgi:hypothetical protein
MIAFSCVASRAPQPGMLIEVKLISVSTNDDVSRDARYITVKK